MDDEPGFVPGFFGHGEGVNRVDRLQGEALNE